MCWKLSISVVLICDPKVVGAFANCIFRSSPRAALGLGGVVVAKWATGKLAGRVDVDNPAVTREDVERIYDELFVKDASTAGGDPAPCKSPKSLGAVPS
jgi:hypothetical protein